MEAVNKALVEYGNTWNNSIPPTFINLYEPLQAEQNKKYKGIVKVEKALKYGSDPRHRINVFTPASGGSGKPVVIYFHGGGLVAGDNDSTPNIYSNLGNYFAKNDCVTCLATYRLALQGGHFPNGAEDVAAALKWVQANIAQYGGDPDKVVALGQSAGAHHLSTSLFLGYLDPNPKPLLRGAVLLSCPFTTDDSQSGRVQAMLDWCQTDNAFEINGRYSPGAIFRERFFGTTTSAPREKLPCELLLMIAEYEADEMLDGTWEFIRDYRKRFKKVPLLEVIKGHNHVSYCLGLGLDDPGHEKVGKRLLDIVKDYTQ